MVSAQEIREKAVYVAKRNIYGEQGANNDGAFIKAMGGVPGEEWCGLYAGYCYRRAHAMLQLPPPKWAWRRFPGRLEVGAKALVKAMSRHWAPLYKGVELSHLHEFRPGDLLAFHRRTGLISWRGHVALCVANDGSHLATLEGNVGEFPAMVQRFVYTVNSSGVWHRTGRSTVPVRFAFGAGLR